MDGSGSEKAEDEEAKKEEINMASLQQQMPLADKVFKMVDMIVKLCTDKNNLLKAVKPKIQGLGDSESDYDST